MPREQRGRIAVAARWRSHIAIAALVSLAGCAGDGAPERVSADTAIDAATDAEPGTEDECVAPAGTTPSPATIADVVALINAMPKPVTLPCFLAALARPLELYATRSVISAQPAVGRRSPRTFLFLDGLTLSVVPEGVGTRLLEMGELRDEGAR